MANSKKVSSRAYENLVAEILDAFPDVETGSLFGMPCLKATGKAALGSFDGGVVFKLVGDAHATALGLDGSVLFDPSGKGRPMKDWVVVTDDHEPRWMEFAHRAING